MNYVVFIFIYINTLLYALIALVLGRKVPKTKTSYLLIKRFINKSKIQIGMGSTFYKKRLYVKEGRKRKKRPKTFRSEESAIAWSSKNNIKKFELKNLRSPESRKKKIRVIIKE